MKFDESDLYAALIHELKNNLVLLTMTLDGIPHTQAVEHDKPLDDSRLLCQRVIERLQQALLLYKHANENFTPSIDAHSPQDFLRELRMATDSLAGGRIKVSCRMGDDVPPLWFFDRHLVEMAMLNGIHNSMFYARSAVEISVSVEDGQLCFAVKDDSDGYPEHILDCVRNDTACRGSGTGLGLQFAKLIAAAHVNKGRAGSLRLSNDQGAVFSILLP